MDTDIQEPSTTNGVGGQDLFSDDPLVAHRGANLCTLAFVLFGRGKTTVSGIATNDDVASGGFVLPVTGGTDEFRHAQGEFEIKLAPAFTDPATLTFRLK